MKKNSVFFAILASGLLFASCAGEEIPGYSDSDLNDTPPVVEEQVPDTDNPIAENVPIEFEIRVPILTKTTLDLEDGTTVNWQDGDRVGVFYRYTPKDGSATTASKACNVPYEYDAETGKFVAVDTPAYWDEGAAAEKHAMYVYYPYNENSTDITAIAGSLPVEQNYDATATQNEVASYGCFSGRVTDIEYGKPVKFASLIHQFGMMRLEIRNTTGSDIVIDKVLVESTKYLTGDFQFKMSTPNNYNVWPYLEGLLPTNKTVTINVANGAVAAGEAVDVRFLMRTGDCSGQTFNVTVTTVGGETYTAHFQGAGKLMGGQRVAKPFNLTSPYKIGDVIGTDGVLFDTGDNISGKVVYYLYSSSRSAFSEDAELVLDPEMSSLDDGQANVEYLKSIDETLEKFPMVKACDDIEGGDWYLPAVNELKSILEAYNGTPYDQATTGLKHTGLPEAEKTARENFDKILLSIGGNQLNLSYGTLKSTSCWSSSWTEDAKAWWVRWARVTCASSLFTYYSATEGHRARCIKKVNFADLQNSTEENPTEE